MTDESRLLLNLIDRLIAAEAELACIASGCLQDEGNFVRESDRDTLRTSRRNIIQRARNYFGNISQAEAKGLADSVDWDRVLDFFERVETTEGRLADLDILHSTIEKAIFRETPLQRFDRGLPNAAYVSRDEAISVFKLAMEQMALVPGGAQ